MPGDSGLEEVRIIVRVRLEPLWPAGPGAGVEELDEHAGDWQRRMHRGSDRPELVQAGLPRAELVIPQVDDPLACEAIAMDRLPAPKHRRVESEATGPAPNPPWEDEPMEEKADGRLPSGGPTPTPHPRTSQVQSHALPGTTTGTGTNSTHPSMPLLCSITCSRRSVAHCLAVTKSLQDSSIARTIRQRTPMPLVRPRGSQTTRSRIEARW